MTTQQLVWTHPMIIVHPLRTNLLFPEIGRTISFQRGGGLCILEAAGSSGSISLCIARIKGDIYKSDISDLPGIPGDLSSGSATHPIGTPPRSNFGVANGE